MTTGGDTGDDAEDAETDKLVRAFLTGWSPLGGSGSGSDKRNSLLFSPASPGVGARSQAVAVSGRPGEGGRVMPRPRTAADDGGRSDDDQRADEYDDDDADEEAVEESPGAKGLPWHPVLPTLF